ncbi:unnamed protein product [Rhizoctonia solani]|uniref:CcmS related domain-containing protein n=1 Tax=Rhizoctonia solani TaxID=456999 RepID=A0A8H2WRX4_9AGAM|nr:unnamed protein product [Rhizoctonia solani]
MSDKKHHPIAAPISRRPSLKRSLTSVLSKFSRKATVEAPLRASSWDSNWQARSEHPRRVGFKSSDPHSAHSGVEIVQSGGDALSKAQDAFTNSNRAVWTRILWSVPLEYDPSAQRVLSKITSKDVVEGLSLLAITDLKQIRSYLETERGAFFCNVDRNTSNPHTLEVDWITFRDTQKTRDKILQREVLKNEPALFVLIYAFRMIPNGKSVALWRRKIDIPPHILRKNANAIAAKRRELRATESQYVIKISPPSKELSDESGLRRLASLSRHRKRV